LSVHVRRNKKPGTLICVNESEYSWFTRPYRRALRQLRLNLDYFIEDCGNVNVFSITDRLKEYRSAVSKSQQLGISIRDLQDIAGVRIVVGTQHEVEVLGNFVTHEQWLDRAELKSDEVVQKSNGYRARHLVAELKWSTTHSMYTARVEIQLLTILEHAFNFISRAWVYKSGAAFPSGWKKEFAEIASRLRDVDSSVSAAHSRILASATLARDDDPLTPFSLQSIVKQLLGEDLPLPEAIDNTRQLIDVGADTNRVARSVFTSPRLRAFRERLENPKSSAARAFGSGLSDMPKHRFCMIFGLNPDGMHGILDDSEAKESGA
jgi:ppGpp synthetase/RelA/SpoT-type nucleotidyltranferase